MKWFFAFMFLCASYVPVCLAVGFGVKANKAEEQGEDSDYTRFNSASYICTVLSLALAFCAGLAVKS